MATLRVGEHVHPGVDSQALAVRTLDQLGEGVSAVGPDEDLIGRGVRMRGVEPGPAPALHLHEEIARAEPARVVEQGRDAVGVLEHALRALGEDPHRPSSLSRFGAESSGSGRLGRDRRSRDVRTPPAAEEQGSHGT